MPRRLFVALWPDATVRRELTMLQARPEIRAAGGRTVPAKNIHMTFRFLGDVEASQQGPLEARLAEFVFEPVTLTLDRVRYLAGLGNSLAGTATNAACSQCHCTATFEPTSCLGISS